MPKWNVHGPVDVTGNGKLEEIYHKGIEAPTADDAREWFKRQHVRVIGKGLIKAEEVHATNS